MAIYGHCKSCWWWNRTGKKTGICWFQTRDEENNDIIFAYKCEKCGIIMYVRN